MTPPPLLIVDDDAPFRARLARAFEQRGLPCLAVADTTAALALAGTPLAGAVVDLRVPPDGGLAVVSALTGADASLPVVVLTGFGSIATALEAVRLGARDYLTKPVAADDLLAALRGERPLRENPKEVPPETPSLDRVEWEHIQRVLADCGGNISQASRLLGIDRRSLQRKLAKYPPRR